MLILPYLALLIALAIAPGVLFHYDVAPKVALLYLGAALLPLLDLRPLLARVAGRWLLRIAIAAIAAVVLSSLLAARTDLV
ncbi:MAG: hypothetical protein NTY38_11495, partial [Acidobacteria bacterium]|nr:hypothetical protein [Acidobacteriota bacterium]